MANELNAFTDTGLTLYVILFNNIGQVYNGSAFVTVNPANWTSYGIAMTEATAGIYLATMPTVAVGAYSYAVYSGASPAITDELKGNGSILWSGTDEIVPLEPTVVGMTLDVANTGEAGLDFSNIKQATIPTIMTNLTVPVVTDVVNVTGNVNGSVDSVTDPVTVGTNNDKTGYSLTVTPPTVGQIDTQLSGVHGAGSWLSGGVAPTVAQIDTQLSTTHGVGLWTAGGGTGAITFTYTVTDVLTALPIDSVTVKVTTDIAGLNVVAEGSTDTAGEVIFYLDAGTYYFWNIKSGYTFVNPDTEIVS